MIGSAKSTQPHAPTVALGTLTLQRPEEQGPKRVLRQELQDAFAQDWVIESIEPSRFEIRPDLKDLTFSDGGPKAWLMVARRLAQ